jgi:hypothetical protein
LDGRAYQPVRVSEWGGSQDPRRLLKKLACSPGRRARRGEILEALWPDIDPKEAGGYLNDAAYKLRAVLQPSKEQRKQSLLFTAEDASSFGLPVQKVLWIDADAQQGNVQEACKLACQALTITMHTKSRAVLERVRTLHRALEPWRETEEVKDLEKQFDTTLAFITAGGTS